MLWWNSGIHFSRPRQNKHADISPKPEGANLSSKSWLKFDKRQIKTIKQEDRIRHVRIRDLANCERFTSPPQWAPAHVQSDTCWVRKVRPNTLYENLFTLQPPLRLPPTRYGYRLEESGNIKKQSEFMRHPKRPKKKPSSKTSTWWKRIQKRQVANYFWLHLCRWR